MSDDDDKNDNLKGKELVKLLATLTPREAKVLRQRFGLNLENDPDLEELGKLFDVTRERIREIERKAKEKLTQQRSERKSSNSIGKKCSFCEKNLEQTDKYVKSKTGVFICGDCLALCNKILDDEDDPDKS